MMRFVAKKFLGQHFLKCDWVTGAMLHAADIGPSDTVLEIGPGTGALTRALHKFARQVIAIEKDKILADELRIALEKEKIKNVRIIVGDILRTFSAVAHAYGLKPSTYKVVANIPYYLTSRLLRMLFEAKETPQIIVLSVQKEVALRLCASPPRMNLLSLSAQFFGEPRIVKTVPASCFSPRPKVESAIIKITPLKHPYDREEIDDVFSIAKLAFSQKRKIIARTLRKKFSKTEIEECLKECRLPATSRPEELSLPHWIEFSQRLQGGKSRQPLDPS